MEHYADVDAYLADSEQWPEVIAALRPVLTGCGLTEEIKWGKPCYLHDGRNILILQEMKDFLAVMFFKGALLDDPAGLLREQGPNSRSAKRLELTSVDGPPTGADILAGYVAEAVRVEDQGLESRPARPQPGARSSRPASRPTPTCRPLRVPSPRAPAVQPPHRRRQEGRDPRGPHRLKYADRIRDGRGMRG
ncbi:MAG: DUF1801 domain-containing protein [Microthrixaceae bacterium]|nr:DUF1801 domain-containing protein [Microthrixaceae bacterium]